MDDRSESKQASKAKQKFYTSRNTVKLSSDNLSNDRVNVVKTKSKHDVRKTEQPGSKPSKSRMSRLRNWLHGRDSNHMKADRPGVPYAKHLFSDKVDIEWDPVTTFCQGDVYEVRIKNIQKKKRTIQTFQTCTGTVVDLEPGTSYIFKVRLIKADGKVCRFGENSEHVITMDESKREFAGANLKHPDIHGTTEQQSGDEPYDGPTATCSQDKLDEAAQPIIEQSYKEEFLDSSSISNRHAKRNKEGVQRKDTHIKFAGANLKHPDIHGPTEQQSDDEPYDGPTTTCSQGNLDEAAQTMIEQSYKEESLDSSSIEQALVNESSAKEENQNQNNISNSIAGNTIRLSSDTIRSNRDAKINKEGVQRKDTHNKEDSYVSMLLLESKLVETKPNGLRLYQLPIKELLGARNGPARTKKFDLGPRNENDLKQKTIMLVGATGTGKSTFVDGLANYILGVRLEDPFRFTVIPDEDRLRQHNQAESQTDWISCYSFKPQPGTRINYILNIIDTPGFGDVRGLERDHETVDQIRQLFEENGEKGVENLDAVCFLLKAPDSRLTVIQRYIFHAIMALFGHNIKGNICTVITFADGTEPPVLSAMKASDLPFGQHKFIFNSSALKSDPNITLTSVFWEINLQNYKEMFKHFEKLETKSARLTKEVLQERRRLDITCQNLQTKINIGLSTIDSLNKEIQIFQDNEEKIKNNENFTYTVTERKEEKVYLPDGYSDTYCLTCNETCHSDCWITYEKRTGWCWAMSWLTGNCGQCRGKCHWREHTNRTYRIKASEVQVTKTYEERKKKFQDAKGNRLTLADVLKKMDKELEQLADSIEKMLNIMLECKTRLMQTALQPSPLEMTDLIDLLINTEHFERRQGYSDRVQVLYKIRERTTIHVHKTAEDFNAKRLSLKETLAATCKEV